MSRFVITARMWQVMVNVIIGVVTGLIFYRIDQQGDITKMVTHTHPPRHPT